MARLRTRPILRIARLLYALLSRPEGITLTSLRRWQNVSRRTVLRDLRELRAAGIRVVFDRKSESFRIEEINAEGPWGPHPCDFQAAMKPDVPNVELKEIKKEIQETLAEVRESEWPLDWSESVELIAILLKAQSDDSQFSDLAGPIADQLMPALQTHFGSRGGNIVLGAKLLIRQPCLPVEHISELVQLL